MAALTQFKLRRGTAAAWLSANPVLAAGEPGFETDTGKLKIGDGSTAWNSLGYTAIMSGTSGATKQVELSLGAPDASGNAYAALVAPTNFRALLPAFLKDVDGDWWGVLRIPKDYASGGAIILRLGANSTAGQVTSFIVSTKVRDTAATWDAALTDETVQDITMSTTAYRPTDATFTLSTTPVAGSDLIFRIRHNGARAQDTLAVDTLLFKAVFQYVAS